jgi:hypothetical protein
MVGGIITAYYYGKKKGTKAVLNDKVESMISSAIEGIRPEIQKALDNSVGNTIEKLKMEVQPFIDSIKPTDKKKAA